MLRARCWAVWPARSPSILRGKNKPIYTPNMDTGDYVIIINADKVVMTGNKLDQKIYYHHSGYVGGLKETKYRKLLAEKPEFAVRHAVRWHAAQGHLWAVRWPRSSRCTAGPDHEHAAQQPAEVRSDLTRKENFKMAKVDYSAVGRRKKAVARVRLVARRWQNRHQQA